MHKPIRRLAQCVLAVTLPLPLTHCGSLNLAATDRPASAPYEPTLAVPAEVAPAPPMATPGAPGMESHPVPGTFGKQLVSYSPSDRPGFPGATLAGAKIPTRGIASFYRVRTNGTRTASGIPLKDSHSTAAHRTLPFGTLVRVTNLRNGRSEVVKITDRGPFVKGRIIDVSLKAAETLGMTKSGIVPVEIEVLGKKPGPV